MLQEGKRRAVARTPHVGFYTLVDTSRSEREKYRYIIIPVRLIISENFNKWERVMLFRGVDL